MPDDTIRMLLEGTGDIIAANDFMKVMQNTIGLLRILDSESQWSIMSASKSSPLDVGLHSMSGGSGAAIESFLAGLSLLESERQRPRGFDDRALARVKRLSAPVGEGIRKLSFVSEGQDPVHVTKRSAASADALIYSKSYEVLTELEGKLGQITVYGGKSEFCIYDPIFGLPTKCKFNPNDAEKVGGLITHRLRVLGKARYSNSHKALSIEVDSWEGPLGEPPLPMSVLHESGFAWEDDRSSEEAIRELRDSDG